MRSDGVISPKILRAGHQIGSPILSSVVNDYLSEPSSSLWCQYGYFTAPDWLGASLISKCKYQMCLIFTMLKKRREKRGRKEKTGKRPQIRTCILLRLCFSQRLNFVHNHEFHYYYTVVSRLFIFVKHNVSLDAGRWRWQSSVLASALKITFDRASMCEIPSLWNRHSGAVTPNSRWSRDGSCSACVHSHTVQNQFKLHVCPWSPTL